MLFLFLVLVLLLMSTTTSVVFFVLVVPLIITLFLFLLFLVAAVPVFMLVLLVLLLLLFILTLGLHLLPWLFILYLFNHSRFFDFYFWFILVLHDGKMFVLLPFLIDFLLNNFQSDFEGFYLCSEFEETLMNFSFEMHLNSFLSVIDSLNCTTDLADLIEPKHTFWCFTTANKLSPIRSTSLRCYRSLSTSSRHRAESSI